MYNMKGGSSSLQTMAGSFIFILLCAGICAGGIPGVNADSPDHVPVMFRADPWHSGVNDDGGTRPADILKWSFPTGDRVYSSPAVVDGIVYLGSDDGKVYALNASTGAETWSYTTGGRVLGSPAVVDGVVYVGSYDQNLYALDQETGALLWSFETDGWVTSSPAVTGGVVYSGSLDDQLYAIDAVTGEEIWNASFGEYPSIDSSPAVADGALYVTGGYTTLYCLDTSDGAEIWNFTTGYTISSSPSVADGIVYAACWDGRMYALDALTGAEAWNTTIGFESEMDSSPAVANGVVYVGSNDDNVYALEALTGAVIWSFPTGNVVYSSPTVANGVVYAGSWDHSMYALDALTGAEIWSFPTGSVIYSSPAIADGLVYFGSFDNNVYAVGYPSDLPPSANFFADNTFGIVPMTVRFTDSSTGAHPLSYQWDFGDGMPNETVSDPVHSYTAEGTYNVTLTVTNSAGTSTLAKPGYIIAMADIIDGGDKAYFLVHSNVEGAEVYFNGDWYEGTIENGTLLVETCTTCTPVWTYTVKKCGYFPLTQENHQYPGKDEVVDLYANLTSPKEPLIADFTANVTEASVPPLTVGFTGQWIGVAETWNWSFGDGTWSAEQDPVHTYTAPGAYTVSLTLTNSACQENTMVKQDYIMVGGAPMFKAAFNVAPVMGSPPLTVYCTDRSFGDPTTIIYDFGDGFKVSGSDVTHTYRLPGTYTITQTIAKYDPATRSFIKSVARKPDVITVFNTFVMPPFAAFSASPVTGTVPLTVSFTDETIGNPTFYSYDFGDGFTAKGRNPVHTYRLPGVYTVSLTVLKVDPGSGSLQRSSELKTDLIVVNAA